MPYDYYDGWDDGGFDDGYFNDPFDSFMVYDGDFRFRHPRHHRHHRRMHPRHFRHHRRFWW